MRLLKYTLSILFLILLTGCTQKPQAMVNYGTPDWTIKYDDGTIIGIKETSLYNPPPLITGMMGTGTRSNVEYHLYKKKNNREELIRSFKATDNNPNPNLYKGNNYEFKRIKKDQNGVQLIFQWGYPQKTLTQIWRNYPIDQSKWVKKIETIPGEYKINIHFKDEDGRSLDQNDPKVTEVVAIAETYLPKIFNRNYQGDNFNLSNYSKISKEYTSSFIKENQIIEELNNYKLYGVRYSSRNNVMVSYDIVIKYLNGRDEFFKNYYLKKDESIKNFTWIYFKKGNSGWELEEVDI